MTLSDRTALCLAMVTGLVLMGMVPAVVGRFLTDRAVVNGAASVSALRASIPSAGEPQ